MAFIRFSCFRLLCHYRTVYLGALPEPAPQMCSPVTNTAIQEIEDTGINRGTERELAHQVQQRSSELNHRRRGPSHRRREQISTQSPKLNVQRKNLEREARHQKAAKGIAE